MLSLEESKKILNAGDRKYTDEEVKQIRDYVYTVAQIQVDMENGKWSHQEESEFDKAQKKEQPTRDRSASH